MQKPAKASLASQKMEVGAPSGHAAEPAGGAPFLFADGVAAFGAVNGTIHVVLEAFELAVDDQQQVSYKKKKVAHLRLTVKAAAHLQEVLQKTLLAVMPVSDPVRN